MIGCLFWYRFFLIELNYNRTRYTDKYMTEMSMSMRFHGFICINLCRGVIIFFVGYWCKMSIHCTNLLTVLINPGVICSLLVVWCILLEGPSRECSSCSQLFIVNFRRNLDTFQNNEVESFASVDADKRLGELTIYLPKDVESDVNSKYLN